MDARVERVRIARDDTEAEAGGTAIADHAGETSAWLIGDGEESTVADAAKRFDGWVSAGPAGELG